MLSLRCKTCGTTFRSGIVTGPAGRPVFGEHSYRCPQCHVEANYTKEDYLDSSA